MDSKIDYVDYTDYSDATDDADDSRIDSMPKNEKARAILIKPALFRFHQR